MKKGPSVAFAPLVWAKRVCGDCAGKRILSRRRAHEDAARLGQRARQCATCCRWHVASAGGTR